MLNQAMYNVNFSAPVFHIFNDDSLFYECFFSAMSRFFISSVGSGGLVAGKKGKMMERRILKDFQIGIVETISEAVKSAASVTAGDVFSTIAKAINKRTSGKKYVFHLMFFFFNL